MTQREEDRAVRELERQRDDELRKLALKIATQISGFEGVSVIECAERCLAFLKGERQRQTGSARAAARK